MVKRTSVAERKAQHDSMRVSVEDFSDWSEGLLACGVPNLQSDYFVLHFYIVARELNSDGNIVFGFNSLNPKFKTLI